MASVEASVGCPDLFRSILGVSITGIFADSSLLQNPELQWRHTARARRSMELLRG